MVYLFSSHPNTSIMSQYNNPGSGLNRRSFIQSSSMLAGGMLISPVITELNSMQNLTGNKELYWYQKPLRIMHTVLRESDAKNYDAAVVVDYVKKIGANTLCVNAGGIVDFFQNPLPAANLNQYMGKRDILGEISTACRKEGIRVICRIDFRGVEEHVYKKFPDWFKKDPDIHWIDVSNGSDAIFDFLKTVDLQP